VTPSLGFRFYLNRIFGISQTANGAKPLSRPNNQSIGSLSAGLMVGGSGRQAGGHIYISRRACLKSTFFFTFRLPDCLNIRDTYRALRETEPRKGLKLFILPYFREIQWILMNYTP